MKKSDERIKSTEEVLSGIKYVKMCGWEEQFLKKIDKKREDELRVLNKSYKSIALNWLVGWSSFWLSVTSMFVTYIWLGGEIDPPTAFGAI